MLDRFKIAHFTLHLRAAAVISLPPYKGSAFRGAFGHALKKAVCIRRDGTCGACLVKNSCVYFYVFETPVMPGAKVMRNYPYSPHPFVLRPPQEARTEWAEGDPFSCELLLVGRAVDYLPYFILTFERMGERGVGRGRGRFTLERITNGDEDAAVYSGETKTLGSGFHVVTGSELAAPEDTANKITLTFLTPARLRYEGALTGEIEFHVLIRALLRRLSLLAYFHCGADPSTVDARGLIEKAKTVRTVQGDLAWRDWERYSTRQDARMKLGGLVGSVTYEGDLGPFLPYLRLGELVHVGKGTSFGLGRYNIA